MARPQQHQHHQPTHHGRTPPQPQPRPPAWKPIEPLPSKYKPAARRVTLAIVALPIAIVTSYALYDRVVLGNERKVMPHRAIGPLAEAAEKVDAAEVGGK